MNELEPNYERFEVFFDGSCPLCKREIGMIRRHDQQGNLILTDIAAPGFENEDHSLEHLMREIHGRHANGSYVTGVQVFREIYSRIGYGKFVWPTQLPIIKQGMDLGYKLFAYLRFRHAMHRMKKSSCDTACGPISLQKKTSGGKAV